MNKHNILCMEKTEITEMNGGDFDDTLLCTNKVKTHLLLPSLSIFHYLMPFLKHVFLNIENNNSNIELRNNFYSIETTISFAFTHLRSS